MNDTVPGVLSRHRRPRLGLSTKLYAAIAGAVALTLAASLVAWISFVELGQLQRRITREHIPSITDSLRLARQSALIAATAPALVKTGKFDIGGFTLTYGPGDNRGSNQVFLTLIRQGAVVPAEWLAP